MAMSDSSGGTFLYWLAIAGLMLLGGVLFIHFGLLARTSPPRLFARTARAHPMGGKAAHGHAGEPESRRRAAQANAGRRARSRGSARLG